MFGLPEIFDVALGLVIVFSLLSLVASWIQELLATVLHWRATFLVNAINISQINRASVSKFGE